MDRSNVIERTNDFVRGRWLNIFLFTLLVSLTLSLVEAILGGGSTLNFASISALIVDGDPTPIKTVLFSVGFRGLLTGLVNGFITALLTGALSITVYKVVEEDTTIELAAIIENAQSYLVPLVVSSLIAALINAALGLIPIIGFVISMVVSYALGFRLYLLADGSVDDGVESIKKSFELTGGHKMDLFMVDFHYAIKPILVGIGGFLISLIFFSSPLFMSGFIILVGLATIGLIIYYLPFMIVGSIMVYLESKKFN